MRDKEATFDILSVVVSSNLAEGVEKWRRGGTIAGLSLLYMAGHGGSSTTNAFGTNGLTQVPFIPARTIKINSLTFSQTAAGAAGSVARVGIYNADQPTLFPTTLLFDSGSIATDAANGLKTTVISPSIQLLQGTLYYFCYVCGVASPTIAGIVPTIGMFGAQNGSLQGHIECMSSAFAFAALPTLAPATTPSFLTSYPAIACTLEA